MRFHPHSLSKNITKSKKSWAYFTHQKYPRKPSNSIKVTDESRYCYISQHTPFQQLASSAVDGGESAMEGTLPQDSGTPECDALVTTGLNGTHWSSRNSPPSNRSEILPLLLMCTPQRNVCLPAHPLRHRKLDLTILCPPLDVTW